VAVCGINLRRNTTKREETARQCKGGEKPKNTKNPLFIGLFMGFLLVPRTGLEPVTLRFEICFLMLFIWLFLFFVVFRGINLR